MNQALDVARGLQYLHASGIVHGDIRVVRPRPLKAQLSSFKPLLLVEQCPGNG
jgi:hypothetical protein